MRRDTDGPVSIDLRHSNDTEAELGSGGGSSDVGQALLPAPTISKEELEQRCAGTLSSWCQEYLQQRPIVKKPPPRGSKDCLW